MSKIPYEDDRCTYLDGHPSYGHRAHACIKLSHNKIDVILGSDPGSAFEIGLDDVLKTEYVPPQSFEEAQKEFEEISAISKGTDWAISYNPGPLGPTSIVWVKDPKGIYSEGMKITFEFRNEYYAKLFIKKIALGLKKSYTKDELNDAIRSYKKKHIEVYRRRFESLESGNESLVNSSKEESKKIFGRNAIARALGVRSTSMVSNSTAWKAIKAELKFEQPQGTKGKKIGLDEASDQKSMEKWKDESQLNGMTSQELDNEATRWIAEAGDLGSK